MPLQDAWLPAAPVPLERAVTPIAVFKYQSAGNYSAMPNLRCLSVENHEGTDPGSAAFRYVFDGKNSNAPQDVEQALGTQWNLPLTVNPGDRLLVRATQPDGTQQWIFDGLALNFGCVLSPQAEGVSVLCQGIGKHAADLPIGGSRFRQSDKPTAAVSSGQSNDFDTSVVVQFNPRGLGNATKGGANSGDSPQDYPVFYDPLIASKTNQRRWTLAMACRFLYFRYNTAQTYVKNMKGSDLDSLLISRIPIAGKRLDVNDSSTFTPQDIIVADTPLTGYPWPIAVRKLTEKYGFRMSYDLTTDGSGNPVTTLNLWHFQGGDLKSLWLDQRGATLDPTLNNVGSASISRDLSETVNDVIADAALDRYEASFVLAPGFSMTGTDATSAVSASSPFKSSDPAFTTSSAFDAYRLFHLNETGDGYYDAGTNTKKTTIPSLDNLFGANNYVRRRRPAVGQLFTLDSQGHPLRFRVSVSTNYAGAIPGLWVKGSERWQHVEGGVTLLKDRLGVRVNIDDPNKWFIGRTDNSSDPFPTGVVKLVELLAGASSANALAIRLTAVVEADLTTRYEADNSSGQSPLSYQVTERVDARDRLGNQIIDAGSEFNSKTSNNVVNDDSDPVKAEAVAVRTDKELGVLNGDVTIPYFTANYQIGDRIDQIQGRNLGFRTDSGQGNSTPCYPVVVGVRWDFQGGQRTILTISDRGSSATGGKRSKASGAAARFAHPRGSYRGRRERRGG